ncbi:hypothetical protein K438DRAFT_1767177 [Mycena galopus ATCC 62051]|nr:hypothetical protein K438DRAFT_1767177 [Mycena galopus ATCC 62051]
MSTLGWSQDTKASVDRGDHLNYFCLLFPGFDLHIYLYNEGTEASVDRGNCLNWLWHFEVHIYKAEERHCCTGTQRDQCALPFRDLSHPTTLLQKPLWIVVIVSIPCALSMVLEAVWKEAKGRNNFNWVLVEFHVQCALILPHKNGRETKSLPSVVGFLGFAQSRMWCQRVGRADDGAESSCNIPTCESKNSVGAQEFRVNEWIEVVQNTDREHAQRRIGRNAAPLSTDLGSQSKPKLPSAVRESGCLQIDTDIGIAIKNEGMCERLEYMEGKRGSGTRLDVLVQLQTISGL